MLATLPLPSLSTNHFSSPRPSCDVGGLWFFLISVKVGNGSGMFFSSSIHDSLHFMSFIISRSTGPPRAGWGVLGSRKITVSAHEWETRMQSVGVFAFNGL